MRDGSLSTPKSIGLTGFLNDVLRDSRPPLIKLFRTDKSAYLYDTGTNRIMECSELEVDLITNILTLGIKEGIAKCKQTHPHDNCLGALRALGDRIISIEDGYIVYDGLPTGVLTKEGAYNGLAEHLC